MYGKQNNLLIMATRFGPSIVGRAPDKFSGNYECGIFNLSAMSLCEEENNLWKLAEAEVTGAKTECMCQKMSDEEILFTNCMKDGWSIDEDGNFNVKTPWKRKPTEEENNRFQVLARSEALEERLSKNPEVNELFNEQVREMIANGVLRQVDPHYPKRYIPLIAVIDLERESTKVRVLRFQIEIFWI